MRIKTFEAPTMQEALILAKDELGEDAVVLNTKHVKCGGLLGMGGSSKVELLAAIDDTLTDKSQSESAITPEPVEVQTMVESPAPVQTQQSAPVQSNAMNAFAARLYAAERETISETSEVAQLRSELKELSSIVQSLIGGTISAPKNLDKPLLLRLGVDEDIARDMLSDCLCIDEPGELTSAIAMRMQSFAMPPTMEGRQVIAVVGPTGVGKTTTLAKLAAKFALEEGKSVAMITADTYRIGAVEQLRTYARIMGVPLEIALSPEEVAQAVEKHSDKDLVLIDTVGRSQRNDEHLAELKAFVDAANPTQTYLTISATLSKEIQQEVVEKFHALSPTRYIFTKLDESPDRSCLINLPLKTGTQIACITAGQNVPQDIDFADSGRIARYLTEAC